MSLASGTRLGTYEIVSLLGAGGMGECASAGQSSRPDVAVKTLPARVAADQNLKRFERQGARHAFSHPHICSVFDVGHATTSRAQSTS